MRFQKPYVWSLFILILAFTVTLEAADTIGTWAIQSLPVANRLQLSLQVTSGGKGNFQSSSAFDISQVQGLTAAQMASPAGTVARFEIVREAGTFICEGYFKAGNGAGTFVFKPNPAFISQMASFGFADVTEDKLFSMAMHDVGIRFASEIQAMGVRVATASQLVSMTIHGVTPDYIRQLQQIGYNPGSQDLVKMRIHGVTPEFADQVRHIYGSASIEDLVRLRIHGVTIDYIRSMQSRSQNITLEQVVRLKIHGIN
jgi:hypothetical protein